MPSFSGSFFSKYELGVANCYVLELWTTRKCHDLFYFRMEKVIVRNTSCQAKVLGTIVSITGAFVVTLYKGPPIIIVHTPSLSLHQPINTLNLVDPSWAIGGLLLTAEYILVPLWYIVQVQIVWFIYKVSTS